MAINPKPNRSIGEVLQSLPRQWLYTILLIVSTVPLFIQVLIPNKPEDSSIDFYQNLMKIPDGSVVLLSSDWTNSTRGESRGEFDAIVKILMRKHIKFVVYSIADPQAPQVARDEMNYLNGLQIQAHLPTYQPWTDWVNGGYFPNGDGTANAMSISLRKAFGGKKDIAPNGQLEDIFLSPVLANVQTIQDVKALIDVTASATATTYVQKLGQKMMLLFAVTGVMGPEALPYYSSGQVSGVTIGIKGVYDLETMMQDGVNLPDATGKVAVSSNHVVGSIGNFPGMSNLGQGSQYYPALNASLAVFILAIVVGNIGMFMVKKEKSRTQ